MCLNWTWKWINKKQYYMKLIWKLITFSNPLILSDFIHATDFSTCGISLHLWSCIWQFLFIIGFCFIRQPSCFITRFSSNTIIQYIAVDMHIYVLVTYSLKLNTNDKIPSTVWQRNEIIGNLGQDSARVRLYWAEDNLG